MFDIMFLFIIYPPASAIGESGIYAYIYVYGVLKFVNKELKSASETFMLLSNGTGGF